MSVINVNLKQLEKLCGCKEKKIIECLTRIGMPVEPGSEEGFLAVEVTPNRPDLFCAEGLSRAVRSYYGGEIPEYSSSPSGLEMAVSGKTERVRPAICAVAVKGLEIDENLLQELMQLQEKLHDTIGRKRRKVAVGIHDLDKLQGKMEYFVAAREKFVPLDMEKEMSVKEVIESHPKGRAFAHLVEKEAVLIRDELGVFSFPPIINGERTRVTTKTKNVLIESTGTSQETVEKVVNIIATALADRGGKIVSVKVGSRIFPDFSLRKVKIEIEEAGRVLGIPLNMEDAAAALMKMGIGVEKGHALVPAYRADIISFTDILEDIAIGYGYENLEPSLPSISTVGGGNGGEDDVHDAFVGMGFLETKNYVLTNAEKLGWVGRGQGALEIKNSASEEFTRVRPTLIPGLLGVFATNKMKGLPQLYYEIGAIYKNAEYVSVCFGAMNEDASLTALQPYLQSLCGILGKRLELKETEDPCFIPGRCAKIFLDGKECGVIGSVHPGVLQKFGLGHPVAICELEERGLL